MRIFNKMPSEMCSWFQDKGFVMQHISKRFKCPRLKRRMLSTSIQSTATCGCDYVPPRCYSSDSDISWQSTFHSRHFAGEWNTLKYPYNYNSIWIEIIKFKALCSELYIMNLCFSLYFCMKYVLLITYY